MDPLTEKEKRLTWWEWHNPKHWRMVNRRRSINWRETATNPMTRACRAVHWSWGRRLLWWIGIDLELRDRNGD
jgi:hypothetical protein